MYETAFEVLEGLQAEDDQVVDLWYLGGWCLYLQGEIQREQEKSKGKESVNEDDEEKDDWITLWRVAREWLSNCAQVNFPITAFDFSTMELT